MAASDTLWIPFAREMTRRIVSGHYPVDCLIPTEAQLGEEFGVSRTVVREGTRVLVNKGLLNGTRGRGTEVLPSANWRSFDPDVLAARLEVGDRNIVLREMLVLRRVIEPELAASAAAIADDMGLARLGASVADLEAAKDDAQRYMEVDARFHDCIAELGSISLLHDIIKILEYPVKVQRALTGRIIGADPQIAHLQHLAIFHCILKRDADGARTAMRDHLRSAEERLHQVLADEVTVPSTATV